jgi:hypothetical protein
MAGQNSWGGQFPLGGSAIQIAAAQNADGRLEIFYVGTNGDLFRNTQTEADGLLWGGQAAFPGNSAQQIAAARNQNGVLEIFYVGTNNDIYHQWQTPPAQGFGSNSNFILASNCDPLLGVTVTIDVTQDIAVATNTGPTSGFAFQLNAFSPESEKCAFQQYGFTVFGSDIAGFVDNWTIQDSNIVRDYFDMVSLPSPKIPAGCQLTVALQNDARANITGATYTVADDSGKTLASVKRVLTSLTGIGALSANASDLAPIVAFELDLVGPVNGEGAILSSGAGTFTYTATTPLTALASEPPCAEFNRGKGTAETANSEYGTLPAQASTSLTQSFSVSLTAVAMWRKKGIARPGLSVPAGTVIPKANARVHVSPPQST